MCGVACVVALPGQAFSRGQLESMGTCQRHRGPDDSGLRSWPDDSLTHIGLSHTRLSILDLSHDAAQPMSSDDGLVTLAYNGEAYNYVELRDELRRLGHAFHSTGDTEVVLRAYLEWGTECFNRLVGMFAVVIVDQRSGEVVLARDPFGIKPLLYSLTPRGWVIASEVKALLQVEGVSRVAEPRNVLRHLRFGVSTSDETTIFRGIRSVAPGTLMRIRIATGAARTQRYFDLRVEPLSASDISLDEAASQLRALFHRSVELHLRSDVPVGCALSGGIDSSSIVTTARRLLGPSPSIHAFTFAAVGSDFDESSWAAQAAEAAGATLHLITPTGDELLSEIDTVAGAWDTPLPGTSAYAQYCVFRAAHQSGIKVMLDGQGADEMLAGYDHYLSARVASELRGGRLARVSSLLRAGRARGIPAREALTWSADFLVSAHAQRGLRRAVGRELCPPWLDESWFGRRDALLTSNRPTLARDILRNTLKRDLLSSMVPHLLRYEDTNSMLWSVESRVPFLHPDIANFCLSLPEEYLLDDQGLTKAVFRRAMRGIVPDAVLDRQDKIGFAPPHGDWLHSSHPSQLDELHDSALKFLPFLEPTAFRALWERSRREGRASESTWRIIFLAEWARLHNVTFD